MLLSWPPHYSPYSSPSLSTDCGWNLTCVCVCGRWGGGAVFAFVSVLNGLHSSPLLLGFIVGQWVKVKHTVGNTEACWGGKKSIIKWTLWLVTVFFWFVVNGKGREEQPGSRLNKQQAEQFYFGRGNSQQRWSHNTWHAEQVGTELFLYSANTVIHWERPDTPPRAHTRWDRSERKFLRGQKPRSRSSVRTPQSSRSGTLGV